MLSEKSGSVGVLRHTFAVLLHWDVWGFSKDLLQLLLLLRVVSWFGRSLSLCLPRLVIFVTAVLWFLFCFHGCAGSLVGTPDTTHLHSPWLYWRLVHQHLYHTPVHQLTSCGITHIKINSGLNYITVPVFFFIF